VGSYTFQRTVQCVGCGTRLIQHGVDRDDDCRTYLMPEKCPECDGELKILYDRDLHPWKYALYEVTYRMSGLISAALDSAPLKYFATPVSRMARWAYPWRQENRSAIQLEFIVVVALVTITGSVQLWHGQLRSLPTYVKIGGSLATFALSCVLGRWYVWVVDRCTSTELFSVGGEVEWPELDWGPALVGNLVLLGALLAGLYFIWLGPFVFPLSSSLLAKIICSIDLTLLGLLASIIWKRICDRKCWW